MLNPFATPRPSSRTMTLASLAVAVIVALVIAVSHTAVAGFQLPLGGLLLNTVLAVLCLWLIVRLNKQLGIAPERSLWLALAFIAGSALLLAARDPGAGPSRAALLASALLLLALNVAYGGAQPWLAGLLVASAMVLRPFSIFCAPFVMIALLSQKPGSAQRALRSAGLFIATAALGLLAFLPFGPAAGAIREPLAALLGAPAMISGLAVPLASPFVAAVAFANWGRRSAGALWVSLGLSAVAQIVNSGLRNVQLAPSIDTLDYLPILLVPLAIAFNQAGPRAWQLWRALILLAIAVGAYAALRPAA
jgi:hypothetical protein